MPQGREEVLNKRSSRAQGSSLTGRPKGEPQNLGKAGKAAAWRKRETATSELTDCGPNQTAGWGNGRVGRIQT